LNTTADLLDAALAGDAGAAFTFFAGAEDCGRYVAALAGTDAAPDVLRAALELAWHRDAATVVDWLRKAGLIAAFRRAAFPVKHLPAVVTAWRGGRGELAEVRAGVSWTLDRDVACFYAHRLPDGLVDRPIRWTRKPLRIDAAPIVLRTVVPRRPMLAHLCGRGEDELILAYVSRVEPDPDPATWRAGFERELARRQAERERLFAQLKSRGGA